MAPAQKYVPKSGEGTTADDVRRASRVNGEDILEEGRPWLLHDEGGGGGVQEEAIPKHASNEALPILSHITTSNDEGVEVVLGSRRASKSSTTSKHKSSSCSCCVLVLSPFVRQLWMAMVACLAGLNSGTIHAFPAVALPRWEEAGIHLTTAQTTWFAAIPMVVSVFVCTGAGVFVEYVGTRRSLFVSIPFLAISWILIGFGTQFWVLIIGRVIQGFLAALYMVIVTVYPVEVSVVKLRGIMMGMAEAMVMLGVFLTYLAGLLLQPSALSITFIIFLLPQLICFYFMRESPLWLARQDRDEEMVATLSCLRGPKTDITWELEQIRSSVLSERIHKPSATEQLMLLKKPIYMKPLILAILVLLFKELTGQYAAMAYTVKIFKMAGSSLDPYWCAVVMGAARFLPCFISWALIERLPRRLLLSSCISLSSFALATLGIFLWFWPPTEKGLPPSMGWVPLACLSLFTLAFGSGVGPTSWTFVAELLPCQVRNVGAGIINTSFSLFLFLVGLSFPYFVEVISVGGVFVLYAVCSLVGAIFVLSCLPETRGRTFDDIQRSLDKSRRDDTNVI